MELAKRTKIGMWMFTVLAVVFAGVDARGGFIHLQTEGWGSAHAKFHMITGLFYTLALCAIIIILTWIPLRRGKRWGWWTIAVAAVTIHGGHFLGDVITHGGLRGAGTAQGPGMIFYSLTGLALVLYIVALFLTRPHVTGPKAGSTRTAEAG